MDALDQLALRAAQDVLAFEKMMPGMQDPEILRAAIRVVRILSEEAETAEEAVRPHTRTLRAKT